MSRPALLLAITLLAGAHLAGATNYVVGDTSYWTNDGTDYNLWAWSNSAGFLAGDTLTFLYSKGLHNVVQVTADGYRQCDSSGSRALRVWSSGDDVVRFPEAGHYYFISNISDDCFRNMFLHIFVAPPPPPPQAPPHKGAPHAGVYIGLSILFVLPCALCVWLACRCRSGAGDDDDRGLLASTDVDGRPRARKFTYQQLSAATDGFSAANLIARGGPSTYKGRIDGVGDVAVEVLDHHGGTGDDFEKTARRIGGLTHWNLAKLIGYCIYLDQRMLVFDYVGDDSLCHLLLRAKVGNGALNWKNRWKIAMGTAEGLCYLHQCNPKILHGELKASNIIIDSFTSDPKVSCYGFSTSLKRSGDQSNVAMAAAAGSLGYLPATANSGSTAVLQEKADVYNFGIILLELVSGRLAYDLGALDGGDSEPMMIKWAKPLLLQALDSGNFSSLVDPRLGSNYDVYQAISIIECAAAAVCEAAKNRPTMSQIAHHLHGGTPTEIRRLGQSEEKSKSQRTSTALYRC